MRTLYAILIIVGPIVALLALSFAYEWLRIKSSKPCIGFEYFLFKLLKRGDYVSINGKVLCFSHITREGETIDHILPPSNSNKTLEGDLAFDNPHSLGYLIYPASSLVKCEFIYGKYGLKWAVSSDLAKVAKEKIDEAIYS